MIPNTTASNHSLFFSFVIAVVCITCLCACSDKEVPKGTGDSDSDSTSSETGDNVSVTSGENETVTTDTGNNNTGDEDTGSEDTSNEDTGNASDARDPATPVEDPLDGSVPGYCGNGRVEIGEVCDDGEANSDDWAMAPHCLSDCSGPAPYCGDGEVNALEECDDKNFNSLDDCSNDCQLDPAGLGPYDFNRVSLDDWIDTARGREVPTDILYPIGLSGDEKPVPMVVFSHGWGANRTGYDYLNEHLASHGYVVLIPQHVGSDSLLSSIADQETIDRALDIRFVLDQAEDLNVGDLPELNGLIDMDKIAVAGHSYGACTALAAGGALIPATDQNGFVPAAYGDPRVDVIAALSPQGPYDEEDAPRHFFNEQSYQPVTLPAMVLSGSEDNASGVTDGPAWRREAYERMPAGDKYLVFIEGATHLYFSDSPACSSVLNAGRRQACENTKRYSRAMVTALLDFYLSDREAARDYLSSAYATKLSETDIEFDSK